MKEMLFTLFPLLSLSRKLLLFVMLVDFVRVKLSKQLKKINEQLLELNKYEEVVHHWGDKMEPMDLDDGVKANYAKF